MIVNAIAKSVLLVLRLVAFPIKCAWKTLRKRRQRSQTDDFPGVYIVSNAPDTLKIGRSKHVLRRLRSYRGYQADGRDIKRLLLIKCKKHKELERDLHSFATEQSLVRMGRTEVFKCSNKPLFIKNVRSHLRGAKVQWIPLD